MRISCLRPDVVSEARQALKAQHSDWEALFYPVFTPPPVPEGFAEAAWPAIAEHVARAERVSRVIREQGFDDARFRFGRSEYAIELATLISAAVQIEQVEMSLVRALLEADIDEHIAYGSFLSILLDLAGKPPPENVVELYQNFCRASMDYEGHDPTWSDRVAGVRDGLASLYVVCGRLEQAHQDFLTRHEEASDEVMVALSASRAFLSAGAVAQTILWLDLGAERAVKLGRTKMAATLRKKIDNLRVRMS